jgi:hypothetical protein
MTAEEIAREEAEAALTLSRKPGGLHVMLCGHRLTGPVTVTDDAEVLGRAFLAPLRRALAERILVAVRRHASRCPAPSPVSDGRLAKIVGRDALWVSRADDRYERDPAAQDRHDLLEHLDFLHVILDGPEAAAVSEAYGRGRRAGFAEGARAQKRIDDQAANEEAGSFGLGLCRDGAQVVAEAVTDAPPATCGAKEDA